MEEQRRNPIEDMNTVFDRITYLELAIADIYEQLLAIQEGLPND